MNNLGSGEGKVEFFKTKAHDILMLTGQKVVALARMARNRLF